VLNAAAMVWEQQTYSAHRTLFVLLCAYFAFSRADAAWSLSHRRSTTVPWWPVALMLSQVSVCYLFGALSKINPVFLSGAVIDAYGTVPVPAVLLDGVPMLTVVVEMSLAVGLWLPSVRLLAAPLGGALHLSIVMLMGSPAVLLMGVPVDLLAFAIACVATYPAFMARPIAQSGVRSRPSLASALLSVRSAPATLAGGSDESAVVAGGCTLAGGSAVDSR
jgi:hypothetical protein